MANIYEIRAAEVRQLQRTIQSIQREIGALGSTATTDALSNRLSQLASQLNALSNRLTALAARVTALENEELVFVAGETIALGDPVVQVADNLVEKATDNLDLDTQAFVGLAKNDAVTGASVRVAQNEPLTNDNWDWYPGVVYLDTDGTLTQDEPVTGNIMIVGEVVEPTIVFVDSRVLGVNAYENLGTSGVGLVSAIFQTTLQVKSLAAGLGITLDDDGEVIHINATETGWTLVEATDSSGYTIGPTDTERLTWVLVDNVDPAIVFVPLDAGVAAGVPIRISMMGVGTVELDYETGVVIYSPIGLTISTQFDTIELTRIGDNIYLVSQ